MGKLILVIGKHSQTARSLISNNFEANYLSSNEINFLEINKIKKSLKFFSPKIIINLASFNQVELAENDPKTFIINTDAVKKIAEYSYDNNCLLIHISSDYVFDGQKKYYQEDDACNPLNNYGLSKLLGEEAIIRVSPQFIILRTSWLYSHYDTENNFLNKVLELAKNKNLIHGVNDTFGSPTSVITLAGVIKHIIAEYSKKKIIPGLYHISDTGRATRYDFIKEVVSFLTKKDHKIDLELVEVGSNFFQSHLSRPQDTSLSNKKFSEVYNYNFSNWKDALTKILKKI